MPTLKVVFRQDDAYRTVFAEGAAAMACKVEQAIYSCESAVDLVADLHGLIESSRGLRDADDPWQDPTTQRWVQHVIDEMLPKLRESVLAIHLVPDRDEIDVKFCVELGAAIMLDKPIVAVAFGDRPVPAKLQAIADEIVYLPDGVNPAGSKQLADALARLLGRIVP